jgi:hypothetical protein
VDLKSFVFCWGLWNLDLLILPGLKLFVLKEIRDFADLLYLKGLGRPAFEAADTGVLRQGSGSGQAGAPIS